MMDRFEKGHFQAIAQSAGISRNTVQKIVANKKAGCSVAVAKRLVEAAMIEGIETSLIDWVFPADADSPAFLHYRREGGMR